MSQSRNGRRPANGHLNGDGEVRQRFTLVPFGSIALTRERPYLVRGVIPREGLVVVWGAPKCGKTFVVLDVSMHIALGWPWRGRPVDPAPVVYVACEGERGLAQRLEAWRQHHLTETAEAPFYLVATRLNLAEEAIELGAAIHAQCPEPPGAIVIDTLNRSLWGSENKDEDMAAYVAGADALKERFKCAVILIHHARKDGASPRGHSSLTGAADAQLAVTRDASNNVVLAVEWMKDGPEGDTFASKLTPIEIGKDEDDHPISSCILEDTEAAPAAKRERLSPEQQMVMTVLSDTIVRYGRAAPASTHIPASAAVVEIELWRKALAAAELVDLTSSTGRTAWMRLQTALQSKGLIAINKPWVWRPHVPAPRAPSRADIEGPAPIEREADEYLPSF